ncbi:MAG: hypothetical protein MZV70_55100 [Desulfobacterales bacterium]|nr:hypothetical protein [Desulfobacterales bacterium]
MKRATGIEGLTIYFADHLYEEQNKEDKNCRKRILIGFENYVTRQQRLSLKQIHGTFRLRLPIHRIRQISDGFSYAADASMETTLFTRPSGVLFRITLSGWLHGRSCKTPLKPRPVKTSPTIFSSGFMMSGFPIWASPMSRPRKRDNQYETRFTVRQKGQNYQLSVPVTFYFKDGKRTERLTITARNEQLYIYFRRTADGDCPR